MATKAYFLIRSAAAADHSRSAEWIRDPEAIPEVKSVYRILGQYDLLVTAEAWADAPSAAGKILANRYVERVATSFSPTGPEVRPRAA